MSPEVNDDVWAEVAFDTLAVRAGCARTNEGEHSEALFLTSSFVFESAAHAAARFGGTEAGNIYSWFTNPTVRTVQQPHRGDRRVPRTWRPGVARCGARREGSL